MTTLTHEAISQKAKQLWQDRGCPAGRNVDIWLEAESQLNAKKTTKNEVENQPSSVQPEEKSIQKALKKKRARAPQVPQHDIPKDTPAQLGKPLWPNSN